MGFMQFMKLLYGSLGDFMKLWEIFLQQIVSLQVRMMGCYLLGISEAPMWELHFAIDTRLG